MATKTSRVVLEILPRSIVVSLTDESGVLIERDRFVLPDGVADLLPASAARDAFNLLYQSVGEAVVGDESDGTQRCL